MHHIRRVTQTLCHTGVDGETEFLARPPIFRPYDIVVERVPAVYLLVSTRNSGYMYIGETKDIRKRLNDHNSGRGSAFTNNMRLRPWALFGYVSGFVRKNERQIFEQLWKRKAMLRRNIRNTLSPMGMMDVSRDIASLKNRNRSELQQLRVQLCGEETNPGGPSYVLVEDA